MLLAMTTVELPGLGLGANGRIPCRNCRSFHDTLNVGAGEAESASLLIPQIVIEGH